MYGKLQKQLTLKECTQHEKRCLFVSDNLFHCSKLSNSQVYKFWVTELPFEAEAQLINI
jgi:hypothetical protein